MNTARINWQVEAKVECPKCMHDNDFMEVDEWWCFSQIGETKDFNENMCVDITCSGCGEKIKVTGSDY